MSKGRVILASEVFGLTIDRLCHQLIENYEDFSDACLIGVQPRGVKLSTRILDRLSHITRNKHIRAGKLDITFFRDDFRRRDKPLSASNTDMGFIIEDLRVVLIDDVLYTGRTIQAAMSALQQFGRPKSVELLTLVDRRFNRHLPIQADYIGITVDSLDQAYVKVHWMEEDDKDEVLIFSHKENA